MHEFETKFIGRTIKGSITVVALAAGILERFETGKMLVQVATDTVDEIISYFEDKYPKGVTDTGLHKYWPRFFYCLIVMICYSVDKTYPDATSELSPKLSLVLNDLEPIWTLPDHKLSFLEKKVLRIFQQEGLLTDNPEV